MNKNELVAAVAKETRLTKKDVGEVVDSTLGVIAKALSKGDGVSFLGFGAFDVRERPARKGRNPRTGQEMQIPARSVPVFRPSSRLKEAVGAKKKK